MIPSFPVFVRPKGNGGFANCKTLWASSANLNFDDLKRSVEAMNSPQAGIKVTTDDNKKEIIVEFQPSLYPKPRQVEEIQARVKAAVDEATSISGDRPFSRLKNHLDTSVS